MLKQNIEFFPVSIQKKVKGTRRLAREKVLQTLIAFEISGTDLDQLFEHIFFRQFNFGEEIAVEEGKLLTPDQIMEIEADISIKWKDEEVVFARELVYRTLEIKPRFEQILQEVAQNWELERIALIDKTLINIAVAELLLFKDIPVKVSINEAIDISKTYSTDKSSTFINGVLDKILNLFKTSGELNKSGRGLL